MLDRPLAQGNPQTWGLMTLGILCGFGLVITLVMVLAVVHIHRDQNLYLEALVVATLEEVLKILTILVVSIVVVVVYSWITGI